MCVPMKIRFDHARILRAALLLALPLGTAGCGGPAKEEDSAAPPAATDPNDVPITEADVARPKDYGDALTRIEGYRDTIRDEIAEGRPTKAHRALDELDIVLDRLPGIARDSGVPKERWETVNTTAQEIRELFNRVHSRIDAKQEPDYDSVSGAIDRAIASLQTVTSAPGTGEPAVKP